MDRAEVIGVVGAVLTVAGLCGAPSPVAGVGTVLLVVGIALLLVDVWRTPRP